jgi:hypothetical protein
MKRRRSWLVAVLGLAWGMVLLGYPVPTHSRQAGTTPPYETPTYAEWADERASIDDSVVFESLLEAAGYEASNTWVDVAAGNFCGGAEQELVLAQNADPNFSVLRGPMPFVHGTGNILDQPSTSWRAVAAGDLDNDGYDEVIAVRQVTASGEADLVIGRVNTTSCNLTTVLATLRVGTPTKSDWVDIVVGNFRGRGNEIALVKNTAPFFSFVRFTAPRTLTVYATASLGHRPEYPWQALAAGNIDGAGNDELIVVRHVTDGRRWTVAAYQWDPSASEFNQQATSTFANTGNHRWISATVGNFGGNKREAIALVKHKHSNFVVMDYPVGATTDLEVLWGTDLNTQPGQEWRGLVATDWLGEDDGHDELIAVRNPTGNSSTDLFVYGAPFHRVRRDTALEGTKALYAGNDYLEGGVYKFHPPEEMKSLLTQTHANTYNINLRLPGEYLYLVEFLEATKDFAVDGRQLRVWVTLISASHGVDLVEDGPNGPRVVWAPRSDLCSQPADSPLTAWNDLDFFTAELPFEGVNWPWTGPPWNTKEDCWDFIGWASLLGQLAQQYPHLVAVGIDDFSRDRSLATSKSYASFTPDYLAEFTSRLRYQQTWLNLVPTFYSEAADGTPVSLQWPDLPLTVDSMLFYFRNDRAEPEPETCEGDEGVFEVQTIPNAADPTGQGEIAEMAALLSPGRQLHVGVYFTGLGDCGTPSVEYSHDLLALALSQPAVTGTTIYTASALWPDRGVTCSTPLDNKYCAAQAIYGTN